MFTAFPFLLLQTMISLFRAFLATPGGVFVRTNTQILIGKAHEVYRKRKKTQPKLRRTC